MTYAGKYRWAYLVILVVMVVILLNAEGCAELILRSQRVVGGQNISYYHTAYFLPEDMGQDNSFIIMLP